LGPAGVETPGGGGGKQVPKKKKHPPQDFFFPLKFLTGPPIGVSTPHFFFDFCQRKNPRGGLVRAHRGGRGAKQGFGGGGGLGGRGGKNFEFFDGPGREAGGNQKKTQKTTQRWVFQGKKKKGGNGWFPGCWEKKGGGGFGDFPFLTLWGTPRAGGARKPTPPPPFTGLFFGQVAKKNQGGAGGAN